MQKPKSGPQSQKDLLVLESRQLKLALDSVETLRQRPAISEGLACDSERIDQAT
jgi:hypothetical protein